MALCDGPICTPPKSAVDDTFIDEPDGYMAIVELSTHENGSVT